MTLYILCYVHYDVGKILNHEVILKKTYFKLISISNSFFPMKYIISIHFK